MYIIRNVFNRWYFIKNRDIETDTGAHNSIVDPGTSPFLADTDGDGVCDGPNSPVTSNCTAGPDVFPHDPSAHTDTDGDGMPDNMFGNSTSTPPLVLDLDDVKRLTVGGIVRPDGEISHLQYFGWHSSNATVK